MKVIYIIIGIVLIIAYIGIKFAVSGSDYSAMETNIEEYFEKIDGRSVLDLDESGVKSYVVNLISKNKLPVKNEDIMATVLRTGDDVLINVNFDYPYTVSLFGIKGNYTHTVNMEKTVTVDVQEEQRRIKQKEATQRNYKRRERQFQADSKEKCDKMGGEWNPDIYTCFIPVYQ